MSENKVCKTCGEEKPIDEFYKQSKARKDGTPIYMASCTLCVNKAQWEKKKLSPKYKEYRKQWEQENKEYRNKYSAEWGAKNKEHLDEYRKEYSKQRWAKQKAEKAPKEKRIALTEEEKRRRGLESQKRWREKNPEKAKGSQKEWREKNVKKTSARWAQRNKERIATDPEYAKVRLEYHRVQVLRRRQVGGSHTIGEWEALKAATGNKCLCCGVNGDEVALTRDHVVPLSKGGTDDISNIQPLCASCNSKKRARTIDYRG